jgi:mono/diheme cytochrome c family protein
MTETNSRAMARPVRWIVAACCLFGSSAALVAGGVASLQGNPAAAKVTNPVSATAESIAQGKQVYQRRCASCHGTNGEGGAGNDLIGPAPSLVDATWDHGSTDGEIFDVIKNGIPPDFMMVAWKDDLKDEEIWSVVNYVRSMAKPPR